jgi:hypothetical protein
VFVADRRRELRAGLAAGGAAACLALLAACGGGGSAPRTLPRLSSTPAAVTSTAPLAGKAAELAAVKAVVRHYYALLNAPTTVANADALARLMTADCSCRRVAESTREVARRAQHYYGKTSVANVRVEIDNNSIAEALVQYSVARSGIAEANGRRLTNYAPVVGAKINFVLQLTKGEWLISQLIYIKAHP